MIAQGGIDNLLSGAASAVTVMAFVLIAIINEVLVPGKAHRREIGRLEKEGARKDDQIERLLRSQEEAAPAVKQIASTATKTISDMAEIVDRARKEGQLP